MHLNLRFALFSIIVCALLVIAGSPAFADTTCACDNGKTVSTTRDDRNACESACSMVGAESGVPAAVDNSEDDDDDIVVAPRRGGDRGRAGRRHR